MSENYARMCGRTRTRVCVWVGGARGRAWAWAGRLETPTTRLGRRRLSPRATNGASQSRRREAKTIEKQREVKRFSALFLYKEVGVEPRGRRGSA
jgi:hypothetical protein